MAPPLAPRQCWVPFHLWVKWVLQAGGWSEILCVVEGFYFIVLGNGGKHEKEFKKGRSSGNIHRISRGSFSITEHHGLNVTVGFCWAGCGMHQSEWYGCGRTIWPSGPLGRLFPMWKTATNKICSLIGTRTVFQRRDTGIQPTLWADVGTKMVLRNIALRFVLTVVVLGAFPFVGEMGAASKRRERKINQQSSGAAVEKKTKDGCLKIHTLKISGVLRSTGISSSTAARKC
ncbi:hypothetical protein C8J57DRAFT_1611444 [Mycena rebaudengoi]|nr:hypothetical protein C8J57DRAFT_1611444 [Mycena rebaudengoi]